MGDIFQSMCMAQAPYMVTFLHVKCRELMIKQVITVVHVSYLIFLLSMSMLLKDVMSDTCSIQLLPYCDTW